MTAPAARTMNRSAASRWMMVTLMVLMAMMLRHHHIQNDGD
jgi:hypothetical protein